MLNPLEIMAESLGYQIGIFDWFLLTIASYIIFGFGGAVFDTASNRFRDQSTGRYVKWEIPLITGTLGDLAFFYVTFPTIDFLDKVSSIAALVISIVLTVYLGMGTRKN
ncbi:hypothetical protein RE474_04605 [Methanolobus sediminis]|uniref:Uncharacterized protein n=1 Tax=Methanolobus sediminis TaxID=3072978 RepID=A0AA51YJV5_9EURY|nr:hypothetical protein [Methanolobus sediminis]WMW26006.1 hypothetical protein RE474_04605 [Methanolobus sediminis]